MKPVAGRWEIDRPVQNDARHDQDRTPAPVDQVALFMAANLRYCQSLAARISPQQCQLNRKNDLYLCGKCTAPITVRSSVPAVPEVPVVPAAERLPGWLKQHRSSSPWREQLYDRTALAGHVAGSTASVAPPAPAAAASSQESHASHASHDSQVVAPAVEPQPLEVLEVPVVPEPFALSDDTRVILRLLAFRHGNQTAMEMTLAGGL